MEIAHDVACQRFTSGTSDSSDFSGTRLAAAGMPASAPIRPPHHCAYRAKDAEETWHFYEDILGLPLHHINQSDYVPSTGEYCPYTHFLFHLQDGSFIAFSDHSNDEAARPSPNTPPWVNHISFRIDPVADLEATKQRQQAGGIDVIGVTDHHIFKSIYFFDPNGVRLELTAVTTWMTGDDRG